MKILNVGPLELIMLFILMFIILGPDDMVNIARRLGRMVYQITHSEIFRSVVRMAQEIRQIPSKFIEETGLDETVAQLKDDAAEISKEMKEIGVDEAVKDINTTTSEVAEEVNIVAAKAVESANTTPPQRSSDVIKEPPGKTQTTQGITAQSSGKAPSPVSNQIQYPQPTKPLHIPAISLVVTESSFDNDFKFSQEVRIQSLSVSFIADHLEPSESLASLED